MARKKTITVTGHKAIDKRLMKLEQRVGKKILRKTMRENMKPVQKDAKANAPKDTGQLKKAIKIRSAKRSRSSMGIDVRIGEGDFKGETFYGSFIEYGAPGRNIEGRGFLRQAYDQNKGPVRKKTMNDIKKRLDAEIKQLGD